MPDILHQAVHHHQQGRVDEAARLYQAILAVQPGHPEALHLLGGVAHQRGDHAHAVELIVRAITANPGDAMYHANLAEAYRAHRKRFAGGAGTYETRGFRAVPVYCGLSRLLFRSRRMTTRHEIFEMVERELEDAARPRLPTPWMSRDQLAELRRASDDLRENRRRKSGSHCRGTSNTLSP